MAASIGAYSGKAYGAIEVSDDESGPGIISADIKVDGTSVVNPVCEAEADSTASDVAGIVADFNSLLAKLRTAGILAT